MLTKCCECGGKVSTDAEYCPHCGKPEFSATPPPVVLTARKADEPTAVCHYCHNTSAPDKHMYFEKTMYWIQKRTAIPLGYKYTEKTIAIPRCSECYETHVRAQAIAFLISAPVGYGLAAWGLYHAGGKTIYSRDGSWIGFAVTTLLFGTVAAGVLGWLFSLLASVRAGIPPEDAIDDHPTIARLKKEGWLMHRPDPATHPETGNEVAMRSLPVLCDAVGCSAPAALDGVMLGQAFYRCTAGHEFVRPAA